MFLDRKKRKYSKPKLLKHGKLSDITKGPPLLGHDLLVLGDES